MRKSNRIKIAVSEKNAKTIRKMCGQKHKKVIRNIKGKKSLSGNAAVTTFLLWLLLFHYCPRAGNTRRLFEIFSFI